MDDEVALRAMLDDIHIAFEGQDRVFVNGVDVSQEIRSNENGMRTSAIAQKAIVRHKMVDLQRQVAKDRGYILDGRDIGSVVLPDAELKIYLIASVDSRAKRRYDEYISKGLTADYDAIALDLKQRDEQDMNRKESPLRKASDAIEVDTSNLTIDEVCAVMEELVNYILRK